MSNLVFSGSRDGMTPEQIVTLHWLLDQYSSKNTIQDFHHGMSGKSDQIAHYAARTYSLYYIIGHPCNLEKWRINVTVDELRPMKPPLDRNQDMIDEAGPKLGRLICTPNTDYPLARPSGTWSTAIRAQNAGLYLDIIQLNGEIRNKI